MGDSPCYSGEELTHREPLILVKFNGEQYPCVDAPARTIGESQLFNTLENVVMFLILLYLKHLHFINLILVFTLLELK
jgi:hypothetical protein